MRRVLVHLFIFFLIVTPLYSSGRSEDNAGVDTVRIGIFVPGFVEGSPTYEMLVEGATRAAQEAGAIADVSEAGFNQAEWGPKLTELAATERYDVIVTSNPAMPAICADVGKSFPNQRFVCVDGYLAGNKQIHSIIFNQVEQGYLIGAMAGLISTSDMPGASEGARVGMVIGQKYPVMDQAIRPGFERGLEAVAPTGTLDLRVVGNWYDATKAAELADSMFAGGVDVILAIAGGANQGVVSQAVSRGHYVLWFDSNGYAVAPGVVVGRSVVAHDRATYLAIGDALAGRLEYGVARVLGVSDGYVRFVDDDPLFVQSVPEKLRVRIGEIADQLESGEIKLPMPGL